MPIAKKIIWSPSLFGGLFVFIAHLDIELFDRQKITPQQMLTNELLVFSLGLVCTLVVFILGISYAFRKEWKRSGVAAINVSLFLICFFIGAYNGVALLYAT